MKKKNELTHSMAHYLLAIHHLKEDKGYARATDIAAALKLTKGSVSLALQGLKKKGLIVEDENRFLSLSTNAHDAVHGMLSSKTLFSTFLCDFLGVSKGTSQLDSCLIEHLLSTETQIRLFIFMKRIYDLEDSSIRKRLVHGEVQFLKDYTEYQEFRKEQ
ncbi:MAG: hypothetical protein HQK50_03015 [Oligoflexia bacterium]|nr:hypothetical protein [Oligoflexia bacterium]MBF0364513.1 hypothetical protein [Oligoflexia bacterium]